MIGSLVAFEAAVILMVGPCGCVHATDGLVLWAMEDTEQLDQSTAVALAFLWASVHVRHVVLLKTVSQRGLEGLAKEMWMIRCCCL